MREHWKVAIIAVMGGLTTFLAQYNAYYQDKTPIHTYQLTGKAWLEELMTGRFFTAKHY